MPMYNSTNKTMDVINADLTCVAASCGVQMKNKNTEMAKHAQHDSPCVKKVLNTTTGSLLLLDIFGVVVVVSPPMFNFRN
jgi:hypothetical protein